MEQWGYCNVWSDGGTVMYGVMGVFYSMYVQVVLFVGSKW